MTHPDHSSDVADAITSLLGDQQTGDRDHDLIAAARETMEVRRRNSINGGAVLAELRRLGYSWRQIETLTGIPQSSARRWADPPTTSDDGPNA